MLKIRDFAKLADVSMTTLRYYDEIGLLKPVHVDPANGYRFYTIDQLPYLHRILALKELGLGLTQIVQIVSEGVDAEALEGMLRLRRAQLQEQIQAEQEQLVRIEARLRSFEHSSTAPTYDVVLKAAKPVSGVSLRLTRDDMAQQGHWTDPIDALLARYGVKPIDHVLVLHDEFEDNQSHGFVDVVAPIDKRAIDSLVARSEGRLRHCELPAVPFMASTLHHGHPALSLPAYHALGSWMEQNAYTIVGARRKLRLRRGVPLEDALTEIQFPIEKDVHFRSSL